MSVILGSTYSICILFSKLQRAHTIWKEFVFISFTILWDFCELLLISWVHWKSPNHCIIVQLKNKLLQRKILQVRKKLWAQKHCGSIRFVSKRNFGSWKILGLKKILSKKKVWSTKIGLSKNVGPTKFFVNKTADLGSSMDYFSLGRKLNKDS